MGIRVLIAGLALLVLAALGVWLASGGRASPKAGTGPRDWTRAPGERPEVPLESAGRVAPQATERETVVTDTPPAEDAFLTPGVQAPATWPGACSLFGRLLDEDGRAVSGPTVLLTDERGARRG